MNMFGVIKRFDLTARVFLILVSVIFPLMILMGYLQAKILTPILQDEMKQVGLSFTQNLTRVLETLPRIKTTPELSLIVESQVQKLIYAQPSIIRVDVLRVSPKGKQEVLASSVDETTPDPALFQPLSSSQRFEVLEDEGISVLEIRSPLFRETELWNIRVLVSLRLTAMFENVMVRIHIGAAIISIILLILVLSVLLRRAIQNEKELKLAQTQNEALSGRLQEAQLELIRKERLAVMGQVTASFAHEIGTPLNALSGHLQMLKMDASVDSVHARSDILLGQVKKIEMIVKGFLATAKSPVSKELEAVSLNQICDRVLDFVGPTLQNHGISILRNYESSERLKDQVWVYAVPVELEQVVLNLVNNAIDAMKEKRSMDSHRHKPNALQVRLISNVDFALLEIKDSGLGILEDHLPRLFKPFFTTKTKGEGHGLGLSICKELIESFGGSIDIQSKKGKGTMVQVKLVPKKETL